MSPAPAAPSVGEPEPPAPRFPRKRLLAIARACTGKATPSEWAMIYKSAASMVWPSVIGEAIAAFRASQAECAALRSSLEEARKDSERLRAAVEGLPRWDIYYDYSQTGITKDPEGEYITRADVLALFAPHAPSPRDEP